MVNRDSENGIKQRRNRQEYSLERIKELASQDGTIAYASTRVESDINGLGYSIDVVQDCLTRLEDEHYKESILYETQPSWLDVYHINYRSPSGDLDELYIKLKLDRDCIVIYLYSFHRDRWT